MPKKGIKIAKNAIQTLFLAFETQKVADFTPKQRFDSRKVADEYI